MGDAGVDVWVRNTNVEGAPSPGMDDAGALDEHERERWARFVDAPAARSYLALHLLARSQIGTLLGRPPESLRFDRTCPDCDRQHGRPLLVDDPGLHLSLSRSGCVVALAPSRSGSGGARDNEAGRLAPGVAEVRGPRVVGVPGARPAGRDRAEYVVPAAAGRRPARGGGGGGGPGVAAARVRDQAPLKAMASTVARP